jgi:uncharacterized HAD superfamily protein
MRLSVDIDGVLLDIVVPYCEIYNSRYGTNYSKKDITNWEFFKEWGIEKELAFSIFYELYEDSSNVPFIDKDAPEMIKLLNDKHDVSIVSARLPQYRESIVKKLEHHKIYQEIHYDELVLLHHNPYDIKLKHNYEIYIDDNPSLVEPIKNMEGRFLLLYDQPWNQESICDKNVFRVYNWKDVYKKVRAITV